MDTRPLPFLHESRSQYERRTGAFIHASTFVALKAQRRELEGTRRNDNASALRRAFG